MQGNYGTVQTSNKSSTYYNPQQGLCNTKNQDKFAPLMITGSTVITRVGVKQRD